MAVACVQIRHGNFTPWIELVVVRTVSGVEEASEALEVEDLIFVVSSAVGRCARGVHPSSC